MNYLCIADIVKIRKDVSLSKFINHYGCVPTIVKKGACICSCVTILSSETIRDNAITGAGSAVTKDVPANAVVAGNPALFTRRINE